MVEGTAIASPTPLAGYGLQFLGAPPVALADGGFGGGGLYASGGFDGGGFYAGGKQGSGRSN